MNETTIQQQIRLELGKNPDVRFFRNSVGHATTQDGYHLTYGLCPGSSDLIGWKSVVVTPDMVGRRVAVFCALEVKTERGRLSEKQANFLRVVIESGGIAGVAKSPEEAKQLLQ